MESNESRVMKENELLKKAIDIQINETEQLLAQKAEFKRVSQEIIKILSRYAEIEAKTEAKFGFEGNVAPSQGRLLSEGLGEDFGFQPKEEAESELQDQLQALSKENFFLKDQVELNSMKIAGYEHKIGELMQKMHKLEAENFNLNKKVHEQAEELTLLGVGKKDEGQKQESGKSTVASENLMGGALKGEVQSLREENANLKKEIQELRAKNLHLHEGMKQQEDKIMHLMSQIQYK